MSFQSKHLKNDPLPWLLEKDLRNPGVRYFALRDLLDRPEDDQEVVRAKSDAQSLGPVPAILSAQHHDGYWAQPGAGYSPSYIKTVWQIIFLAELGADPHDPRVKRACEYFLDHYIASNGALAMDKPPAPSNVVHCFSGDPLYALFRFGYVNDPRVLKALQWQVQAITGEGEVIYYRSGTSGPGFACAYNQKQPCAWGAAKALKALNEIPEEMRDPGMRHAIDVGIEFLLSHDLSIADYPFTNRINAGWFKFGFPLSYRSDILETYSVLADLGYGNDTRLDNALKFILSKQNDQGQWVMEKTLNNKMWIDIEEKGKPSKWLTLQVLRLLKEIYST